MRDVDLQPQPLAIVGAQPKTFGVLLLQADRIQHRIGLGDIERGPALAIILARAFRNDISGDRRAGHPQAEEEGLVDLLAVDVEGWELTVLRGIDFKKYPPQVVIIENLFDDPEYGRFMNDRGYQLWRTVSPNEIYCAPNVPREAT